jgi:hypothetical protein
MEYETYTLAPSIVVEKARRLRDAGLYEQALDLLRRNCVEAHVYPTHVDMSIPRPAEKVKARFEKGHSVRRGVKKQPESMEQSN